MPRAQREFVVEMPVPAVAERWTLEEEDMPETPLHELLVGIVVSILRCWIDRTGRDAMVGRNIALRWSRASPNVGVDPDVYLVEPAPPLGVRETSLCLWKKGHHAPRIAVEVVSEGTAEKDYFDGPPRYAASGTRELWIFDPLELGPNAVVLQVFRRTPHGRFKRVYGGRGPAFSRELGAWIVLTTEGQLRIADDAAGRQRWPTEAEHAVAMAVAAEARARAVVEARAASESEARRQAEARARGAESEVERLRAKLARSSREK